MIKVFIEQELLFVLLFIIIIKLMNMWYVNRQLIVDLKSNECKNCYLSLAQISLSQNTDLSDAHNTVN